jgi:O-antigen ligase/Tfp pilus assembly protein PilF
MNRERALRVLDETLVWLLAAYIVLVPLILWPGSTDGRYTKTAFAVLGLCVLVVLWSVRSASRGRWAPRVPWIVLPALGVVAAGALSLIPAAVPCIALQSVLLFLAFTVLMLLVAGVVRDRRDVHRLLSALVLAAAVAGVYGLLQSFGIGAAGRGSGSRAMISLLGNPNVLGGFAALAVFPCTILVRRLGSRLARIGAGALLVLLLAVVLLVNQVGTVIALGVAAAAFGFGALRLGGRSGLGRRHPWRTALLLVIAVAFLAGALLGPLRPFLSSSRWGSPLESGLRANSGTWRELHWRAGLRMLGDHPLLGIGLGHYKLASSAYVGELLAEDGRSARYLPPATQAHNDYLQFAAELGAVGIAAILALLVAVFLFLWRRARQQESFSDRLDLLALLAGLLVFAVHAVVSFPAHLPSASLVPVLLLGLAAAAPYGERIWRRPELRGAALIGAVALASAVAVTAFAFTVRDVHADVLLKRGTVQLQSGQAASAEATLSRSLALDLCPRQAYFYRATARLFLADQRLADAAYADATRIYEEARRDLERARERFPEPEVFLAMANLGLRLEDPELLRDGLSGLLTRPLSAEQRMQALYLDALRAKRQGEAAEAEATLRQVTRSYPDYVRAYIALAELLEQGGRDEEARALYEEALALAEEKLAEAEERLVEGAVLSTAAFSRWARQRAEAIEEIRVARRALGLPAP